LRFDGPPLLCHPFPPGCLPFGPGRFPPEPIPLVGSFLVLVTIMAITAWHVGPHISLHYVIIWRAWNRKFVWAVINRRQHAREVVVRRRRRSGPFERRRFPWIVARLLAFEDAPEHVEVEQYLGQYRDDGCNRDEQYEWMQRLQKLVLAETRIASRHADDSHDVHRHKDRVDADERQPEMNLANPLVHQTAKHLREPEVERSEHSEDRSHTHHQVEVSRDDIRVVHRQVERTLAENQARDTARHEERNESQRKQHRRGKANTRTPQRTQPVERLHRRRHTNRQRQN